MNAILTYTEYHNQINAKLHSQMARLSIIFGVLALSSAFATSQFGSSQIAQWLSLWMGLVLQCGCAVIGLLFAVQHQKWEGNRYSYLQHGGTIAASLFFGGLAMSMSMGYGDTLYAMTSLLLGVIFSIAANMFGWEWATRN